MKNHIPVPGIVDSGADYTFLPVPLAAHLGIDLGQCLRQPAQTAGGAADQYVWQAGLDAEVQQLRMTIHLKTAFAATPYVLLGREDFFAAFRTISFDQVAERFTLEAMA